MRQGDDFRAAYVTIVLIEVTAMYMYANVNCKLSNQLL